MQSSHQLSIIAAQAEDPPPAEREQPAASRDRKRELRVAGQVLGEAIADAVLAGDRIVETVERVFAELNAKLDCLAAAIAEQPARPIEAAAAPAPTLPELLDKHDLAKLLKISERTVGRMMAFRELPDPERIEPSPERKQELADQRKQQRQLNGEAPKGKPKGRGLGKAVWRREIIEQWLAEKRRRADDFKPKAGRK